MSAEKWAPIPRYEGICEVSDRGRVRSLDRMTGNRWARGALKKTWLNDQGYLLVVLCKNGGNERVSVHALVLEAFVGPRPAGMVTRHLNGDSQDNRLENLTYGTQRENLLDRVRHGTDPNASKTHCPQKHPYSGSNLGWRVGERARVCMACQRDRSRRYRDRKRARAADSVVHA
jgi:hypothetical protein